MISNLDIERRKTGVDKDPEYNKYIMERSTELHNYDVKTLNSKRFSRFMQKLIRIYTKGGDGAYVPMFVSRNFPYLAVSKFNSYDLESVLVYDYVNNFLFFKRRVTL